MFRSGSEASSPRVQRQADRWLLRIKTGQATAREVRALQRWCAERPTHAEAFEQARRDWAALGGVCDAFRALRGRSSAVPARPMPATRRFFLGSGLAVAGTAAMAAMVDPPLGLWPSLSEWQADHRTGPGEQRRVDLAPGLQLELNTRTSVSHRPVTGRDELTLIAGEVAVATDRGVDLIAGGTRVVVRTGEVLLARVPGGVRVTALHGDVTVHHAEASLRLAPHQQVRTVGGTLGAAAAVDVERIGAWRHGAVVFRDTPLAEAVDEINRYRTGRVMVLGDELARRQVSGRFQITRLDQVIDQFESALGARVRRMPGGVVVLS